MARKTYAVVLIILLLIVLTVFSLFFVRDTTNQSYFNKISLFFTKNKNSKEPNNVITRDTLFGKYLNNSSPKISDVDAKGFSTVDNFFMSKVYTLGMEADCFPTDYASLNDDGARADAIIAKNAEMRAAVGIEKKSPGVTYSAGMTVVVNGGAECNFLFFVKDGLNLIVYQHRDGHYEVVNVN